ncbi:MAG: hypothetical protein JWN04_3210 [Myxococcaceae bacterium]|nr:hypothetical protein [Myxococcaceae bacterium]
MQTENVTVDMVSNSNAATAKDPVLLGVPLPLSVTLSAATQVKNAWLQAATEVVNAAKAMATEKKAAVAKKASEVTA